MILGFALALWVGGAAGVAAGAAVKEVKIPALNADQLPKTKRPEVGTVRDKMAGVYTLPKQSILDKIKDTTVHMDLAAKGENKASLRGDRALGTASAGDFDDLNDNLVSQILSPSSPPPFPRWCAVVLRYT